MVARLKHLLQPPPRAIMSSMQGDVPVEPREERQGGSTLHLVARMVVLLLPSSKTKPSCPRVRLRPQRHSLRLEARPPQRIGLRHPKAKGRRTGRARALKHTVECDRGQRPSSVRAFNKAQRVAFPRGPPTLLMTLDGELLFLWGKVSKSAIFVLPLGLHSDTHVTCLFAHGLGSNDNWRRRGILPLKGSRWGRTPRRVVVSRVWFSFSLAL